MLTLVVSLLMLMMRATLNPVEKAPVPSDSTICTSDRSQFEMVMTPASHSAIPTSVSGVKPAPTTSMVWPSANSALGEAVRVGLQVTGAVVVVVVVVTAPVDGMVPTGVVVAGGGVTQAALIGWRLAVSEAAPAPLSTKGRLAPMMTA